MENTGRTAMTVARRWYHPASGTPKLDTNEQLVKTITQLAETFSTCDAGTDLRMDYADACSLGLDGEQYCLPIVDEGTEHLVNFNRKLRYDPV